MSFVRNCLSSAEKYPHKILSFELEFVLLSPWSLLFELRPELIVQSALFPCLHFRGDGLEVCCAVEMG